jgi:hypothetical protein
LYSLPPGTFDNEDDVSSSSGSDIDGDDEAIDADVDDIVDIDDIDDGMFGMVVRVCIYGVCVYYR